MRKTILISKNPEEERLVNGKTISRYLLELNSISSYVNEEGDTEIKAYFQVKVIPEADATAENLTVEKIMRNVLPIEIKSGYQEGMLIIGNAENNLQIEEGDTLEDVQNKLDAELFMIFANTIGTFGISEWEILN